MDTDFASFNSAEVNIQLSEDDYRGTEPEENIRITVSKDARIATSVSLTVSPVVLSEARRHNIVPMNLADDNQGHSPVEAGERTYSVCQLQ